MIKSVTLTWVQNFSLVNARARIGVARLDKKTSIERKIIKIVTHPSYYNVTLGHDIALIKMDKKINFQHNILPVCLPGKTDRFGGT